MNKQLKKKIETELAGLINSALSVRNKQAAGEITKHIKDGVKSIAKKFVKHLPQPAAAKRVKAKKTAAKKRKSAPKKSKASKPAASQEAGTKSPTVKAKK